MYSSIQVLHIGVPIHTFGHMEWCHDQYGWIYSQISDCEAKFVDILCLETEAYVVVEVKKRGG
jgi:hypothetical protein